jgi:hypothetical protein
VLIFIFNLFPSPVPMFFFWGLFTSHLDFWPLKLIPSIVLYCMLIPSLLQLLLILP